VDEKLLGWLVDEQAPALELYARQWCDCPQDMVQEALLELLRQREPPERVIAWLFRVVRNKAINASRSIRRRRKHEEQAAAGSDTWFVPSDEDRLDAQAAAAALEALPLEQRETIVARLWGGLSFDEIAELTQTSSSTAHRRYHTGLAALRERLGGASENQLRLPNPLHMP
jgi:RNA polymerase sigma factor (sigma-70 family)